MPSHSAKQHRFMEAIAHSPSFAKKAGVPQSVGKEFAAADKGKTFKKGGEMKESKAMIKKEVAFMKAKGAPKSMIKHEEAEAKGYRRGGRIKRYDEGGISEGPNKNIDDDTRARALAWAGDRYFFGFTIPSRTASPVETLQVVFMGWVWGRARGLSSARWRSRLAGSGSGVALGWPPWRGGGRRRGGRR